MGRLESLGQSSGVLQKSLKDRTENLSNPYKMRSGLIIGRFRRGRTDKPMLITKNNIRSKLGHDLQNPDYIAVQACLDTLDNEDRFNGVKVLRVLNYEAEVPIFGDWIISPNVIINYAAGTAHYTAYKTNGYDYYDSHADIDLTNAIINSFGDTDMQQWQAFKDAANELTGVTDWVFDAENNQIKYTDPNAPIDPDSPALEYYYIYNLYGANKKVSSINEACVLAFKTSGWAGYNIPPLPNGYGCYLSGSSIYAYAPSGTLGQIGSKVANPAYDPEAEDDREKSIPLDVVAQKVISNASSSNQGASLLAETYLQEIAKSIFNENAAKKFVNLNDLINEFEKNKVLRSK